MQYKAGAITHIPVLIEYLNKTTGDVLEMGMGIGSTPILHMLCQNRKLFSYDNDKSYCDQFLDYKNTYHDIIYIDNWDKLKINQNFGIVLIDHRPAMRRHHDVIRFKNNADYIICHDTEPEIDRFYRYSSIYHLFKYRKDYTQNKAYTTVLSNKFNL